MTICTFDIDAETFARVYLARSTEVTRYYLQGVFVEPNPKGDGAILTATNGHILVSILDDSAKVTGSAIVTITPDILRGCKISPRAATRPRIVGETTAEKPLGELFLVKDDGSKISAPVAAIDGSFPEWRRVVPNSDKVSAATIDASLLATVAEAVTRPGTKTPFVTVRGDDDSSPHLVYGNDPFAFGVIMPSRAPITARGVPAWAQR